VAIGHDFKVDVTGNFFGSPQLVFGADTLYADTANGGGNLFLAVFDTSGNQLSANTPTGNGSCGSAAIAINDSGTLFLCGSFSGGPIVFETDSLPVSDSGQAFLVKLAPLTGTSVGNLHPVHADINVYPVPASGMLNVGLPGNGYSGLTIFDMAGRSVMRQAFNPNVDDGMATFDTHRLACGTYLLQVVQRGLKINREIAIAR
jgi:Secretion system C-terminal sorting domain